ncbi:MAG: adenosine kinase [Hyphomicrobiales bacterium]|nr:adenosine kinase [Hyphomicrobiales bacterium]
MSSAKYNVLGIGNAIVDVLSRVEDSFISDHDIAKGTMQLIDEDRAHALYDAMGPAVEISGGSGANTIAGVAGFGGTAAFVGKVRNDQLGEVFAHDIRATGVSFTTPLAETGPATARCLVLVTPDGERSMNTYLGACVQLNSDDIDPGEIAAAEVTYMEGYLWDPPEAKKAFLKAAAIARGADRQVSLSLSDPFCVDRYRDSFAELVENEVDILFANEDEIKSLYQVSGFDDALQAVRGKCKIAALTRSAAGSVIVAGDEVHVIEATKVDEVVDTTGAGDLYAAGFLYGLATGKDLATCARLGSLAAGEIISHIGARPEANLAGMAKAAALI